MKKSSPLNSSSFPSVLKALIYKDRNLEFEEELCADLQGILIDLFRDYKTCLCCNQLLHVSAFYTINKVLNTSQSTCKQCYLLKRKEEYQKLMSTPEAQELRERVKATRLLLSEEKKKKKKSKAKLKEFRRAIAENARKVLSEKRAEEKALFENEFAYELVHERIKTIEIQITQILDKKSRTILLVKEDKLLKKLQRVLSLYKKKLAKIENTRKDLLEVTESSEEELESFKDSIQSMIEIASEEAKRTDEVEEEAEETEETEAEVQVEEASESVTKSKPKWSRVSVKLSEEDSLDDFDPFADSLDEEEAFLEKEVSIAHLSSEEIKALKEQEQKQRKEAEKSLFGDLEDFFANMEL
jgi:hypothetical protein